MACLECQHGIDPFLRDMNVVHELRVAVRRLSVAPLFACLCLLGQALGIGVTASFGSLLAALFEPQRITDHERVVDIQRVRPGNMLSSSDVEFISAEQTVFTDLLPWARGWAVLSIPAQQAQFSPIEIVGGNYFSFVGTRVQSGRPLIPEDAAEGSPNVAVISDALWTRLFGRKADVVGSLIALDGQPVEIVGVAEGSFRGIALPTMSPTTLWIPTSTARRLRPEMDLTDTQNGSLHLKGRLRPGISLERADAELRVLAGRLDAISPLPVPQRSESYLSKRTFRVQRSGALDLAERADLVGTPLGTVAFAATGAVFLVVCLNLGILSVTRAQSRRHEMAVRVVLGASRLRLLIPHFLESAIVWAGGMVGGSAVGLVLLNRLVDVARTWPGFTQDFVVRVHLFYGFLLVTGVSCLAAIALGPVPLFSNREVEVVRGLTMKASVGAWRSRSSRQVLIVSQIVLAFLLVSIALLCARQVRLAALRDSGIDLDRLAVVQFNLRYQPTPEWRGRATLEQILRDVKRLPGVETACVSSGLPVGKTIHAVGRVTAADRPFVQGLHMGESSIQLIGSPEIFRTLGLELVRGRFFDFGDREGGLRVVVVSQATANKLFGTLDVIGREILVRPQRWVDEPQQETLRLTVVGLASDTDTSRVGTRREAVLYLPFAQHYDRLVGIVARTAEPERIVGAMRARVGALAPHLAVFVSGTGAAVAEDEQLLLTGTARVAALLGAAALVLSMAGIGGTLWTTVIRRRHEIAVRMALGATPRVVASGVLREGIRPVMLGIVGGGLTSVMTNMLLRPRFLRFVPPLDGVVLTVVPLLMILVGMCACYLPARYASKTDPQKNLTHL